MNGEHNWNDDTRKLLSKHDWISVNTGKRIGITLTESVYGYLNYTASGKRINNKKGWQTVKRNITDDQFAKEYSELFYFIEL